MFTRGSHAYIKAVSQNTLSVKGEKPFQTEWYNANKKEQKNNRGNKCIFFFDRKLIVGSGLLQDQ